MVTSNMVSAEAPEAAHLQQRSLWCRWAVYSARYVPHPAEVKSLLDGFPTTRKLLQVGCLDGDREMRLAGLLGLQDRLVATATGADLASRSEMGTILCTDFRYCPDCLRMAFHSMVHQHLGLQRCPVHGSLLVCACRKCGAKYPVTIAGVAIAGLACRACGSLTVMPGAFADAAAQATPWAPLLEVRAALGLEQGGARASWQGPRHAIEAVHSRQVMRWSAWSGKEDATRRYAEESPKFASKARAPRSPTSSPVIDELKSLHEYLLEHHGAIADLAGAVGEASGARLRGNSTVAAAAFYRTCLSYRVKVDARGIPLAPANLEICDIVGRPKAMSLLPQEVRHAVTRAEVRAIYAMTLLEFSRLGLLQDVAWNEAPARNNYAVPWRLSLAGAPEFRLRPRVTQRVFEYLVARRGAKLLLAEPGGPIRDSLQRAQRVARRPASPFGRWNS